jgi:hypothetical protein
VSPRALARQAGGIAALIAACVAAGLLAGTGRGIIALAFLAALAGVAILVQRPLLGALVLVSAVPALSGLDRGMPIPGLRLSEVLIVGIALVTALTTRSDPWRKFDWIVLAYVLGTLGLGLFDLSSRGAGLSSEALGKLIGPLEFFLLYRTVRALARKPADRRTIVKWMLLASVPVALLALMQFANVPGTRALATSYAGETDSLKAYHTFYRATALFAQGHLLDSYLMLIVLVSVAYLFDSRPLPLAGRTMFAILALDGLAMGATVTVTPILGVTAGILALAFWYRRLGRAALAVAVAAMCAILIFGPGVSARVSQETARSAANGGTPSTLSFRLHVWTEQYLPVIDRHLATGYGPDLPPGSVWEFTESAYVTLLLRGGLPLLLLFGWLMWTTARHALTVEDDRRPLARTMFVVVLLLVVMHGVDNYFFDAGLPQVWWGLAGLLFAGTTGIRRSAESTVAGDGASAIPDASLLAPV